MLQQKDFGLFLISLEVTVLIALWLDNKYNKLHAISLGCCANSTELKRSLLMEQPTRGQDQTETIKEEFNI